MKKVLSLCLVAASMVLASTARAQEFRVKAEIPFDFVIGNRAYPAGSYDIQKVMAGSSALLLDSGSKVGRAIATPNACSALEPAKNTKLVFHRVGDTYFLYQIWVAGRDTGGEFPEPKTETLLAQNEAMPEVVITAANLIK